MNIRLIIALLLLISEKAICSSRNNLLSISSTNANPFAALDISDESDIENTKEKFESSFSDSEDNQSLQDLLKNELDEWKKLKIVMFV